MIRLGKSRRDLAMVGASAFALAAVWGTGASAQTALSDQGSTKDASTVKEVVVTGQRAALKSAQKIKQNAGEIVDSIVADDIGKLPDRSVTEALQRVVGVTIDHTMARNDPEHFSVEGSGVNIRGLTYVRSELNGRDSFTANGGRSLSFEDVPPELMAGVDVYKNPSAEQIEGAIGGLVNLRTAMPFDFKGPRVSVAAEGSWGDLSQGKPTPSVSLLASDRWQTPIGEFGALIDFASSESQTRTDAVEQQLFYPRLDLAGPTGPQEPWMSGGASWRTLLFDRRREGDYAALQWRPNANILSSLTFFRSHYKMHWDENAIFTASSNYNILPLAGTQFQYDPKGVFQAGILADPSEGGVPFNDDTRFANRVATTTDVSWNTKWDVNDRLTVTTDLQYVRSTANGFDSTIATGINIPNEGVNRTPTPVTINVPGGSPMTIPGAVNGIPSIVVDKGFMSNPANYYWGFTMDEMDRAVGKELAWSTSADYKFGDGFFKSLRAGVRLNRREADNDNAPYNWQAVSQTWMKGWYIDNLAYLDKFPAPTRTYDFPNFFNGALKPPSGLIFPAESVATGWPNSYAQLGAFRQALCQAHAQAQNPPQTCSYTWTPTAFGPGTLNTQRELTQAAYATLRFGTDQLKFPIDGNIGLRVVHTDDTAAGNILVANFAADPNQAGQGVVSLNPQNSAISGKNNFTDVLPSLNIRVKLTPTLQARFAAAKAIARPDFSQLQAYTSLSTSVTMTCVPGTFSGQGQNPCVNTPNSTPQYQQFFNGTASGNPELKPTKSTQLDATLEWYFAPTGSLTFAVFHKDLSDVVINQLLNIQAQGRTFTTTGPVNGANGAADGFELAYQQYFDFLPGPLKGFGVQANYTYVSSSTRLYKPVNDAYCSGGSTGPQNLNLNLNGCDTDGRTFGSPPLANLSKNAFNLNLLYDLGPFSGRLAYNWREKYLQVINANGYASSDGANLNPAAAGTSAYNQHNVAYALPAWAADYGQLDGSFFYKLPGGKVTIGLEAQNLTDATYKLLQQQHIGFMGRGWYVTGRRYTLQLRATF